jgi:hypothetical protein
LFIDFLLIIFILVYFKNKLNNLFNFELLK